MNSYESFDILLYIKSEGRGNSILFDYMNSDEYNRQINGLKLTNNYTLNKIDNLDFFILLNKDREESYNIGISFSVRLI